MNGTAADHYSIYYADKLWNLLPAIYRALDTDQLGANGPLREMVNRIGFTAAALRRDIDRLWENQSIEACDDWAIPYIGQLLDTRLVLGLDPRGQRLDVANTISYRRRKGTIGVLEQVAHDISGWDARVVEFFRRLGRTRHGLDPPIGPISAPGGDLATLHQAEGLVGPLTHTPIGGFANLRNVYGSGKSRTAFDEFFHTADTRVGQGLFGWHAIPHLGVFVWRLLSFPVGPVTPVAVQGGPDGADWYAFDPTGRDIPLFAASRGVSSFGDVWVSPSEGQLPTPISQPLLDADIALGAAGLGLYPVEPPPTTTMPPPALSVAPAAAPDEPFPAANLTLRPERGRFQYSASPQSALVASYRYGFPSEIGAGPYDRRGQQIAVPTPGPSATLRQGGPLPAAWPEAQTIIFADSLTYTSPTDLDVTGSLTLISANAQRPLIRLDAHKPWIMNGIGDVTLALDGLFVSGADVVLTGNFVAVTLTCCTFDPGSAAFPGVLSDPNASPPAALYQISADRRDLAPTRLWIEATVASLTVDRCVMAAIRTRNGGTVATGSISNSTLQAIRTASLGPIRPHEVKDPLRFERQLQLGLDPVSASLNKLNPAISATLGQLQSPPQTTPSPPKSDLATLLDELNPLAEGPSLYSHAAFSAVVLSAETRRLRRQTPHGQNAAALNRLLLEDAFPLELADAALAFADGDLSLTRCTVMGRIVAHRFSASECILAELALVDDTQNGCLRFTAYAQGSRVPKQYECVAVAQSAPLFSSGDFGQPGYAQLLPTADLQRLPQPSASATPQNTISAGAADGSEMGAYARDKNPIRAQALLLKLQEYMPANLAPIIVNVT